jgi:hypothetical protein
MIYHTFPNKYTDVTHEAGDPEIVLTVSSAQTLRLLEVTVEFTMKDE